MLASSQVVFYDQVSCSYKQLLFFFICLVFLYLSQFCFQNAVLDLSDFQHIFFKCSYINNPPIPLVFFFFLEFCHSGLVLSWPGAWPSSLGCPWLSLVSVSLYPLSPSLLVYSLVLLEHILQQLTQKEYLEGTCVKRSILSLD